jgi:hypothetical protein
MKHYKCPVDNFHKIFRKDDCRSQVGVIGTPGHHEPVWQYFYKMMDRATFRFVDPVIHLSSVYKNKIDEFSYMYAAKNWHTMRMYHDNSIKERHRKIIENARNLVVFRSEKSEGREHINSMLEHAELLENKITIFDF